MSPPQKKKLFRFPLSCGCRDSQSVAVSDGSTDRKPQQQPPAKPPDTDPSSTRLSSSWEGDKASSSPSTSSAASPGFSGLLRQLGELEHSLRSWAPPAKLGDAGHCRSLSESGRIRESVAVVKDSDDPLTDFRRSMLHMIVEKQILGPEELAELVRRLLELNSPQHHDVILRAFAEIWNQVFSRNRDFPDFLANISG